jgi:general secretion pathway protein B
MSYILDALKKADAQRERDPARGIHAQAAALAPAGGGDGVSPWVWAGAAGAVALVAVAGWSLFDERDAGAPASVVVQNAAPARLPPVPAAAPAPVAPPPAREPAADAVLPPPEPAARETPSTDSEEPQANVRRRRRIGVPVPPSAAGTSPVAAAPAAIAPPGPPPGARTAPAATTPAAPPAAAPTTVTTGLPADAPKLAISGGVYSSNRSQRMLIVNGQVVNEGADLGAGVVLEEIKPKSAVLRFRGARYDVAF